MPLHFTSVVPKNQKLYYDSHISCDGIDILVYCHVPCPRTITNTHPHTGMKVVTGFICYRSYQIPELDDN